MKLTRLLTLNALILGAAMLVAFLGARSLARSSDYLTHNFSYIAESQRVLDLLEAGTAFDDPAHDEIRTALGIAQRDALWCQAPHGVFARLAMRRVTDQNRVELCQSGVDLATTALAITDKLLAMKNPVADLPATVQLRSDLADLARQMRDAGLALTPLVSAVQMQLESLVYYAIGAMTLALGAMFLWVSRRAAQVWAASQDQHSDLTRMTQRLQLALDAASEGLALFASDHRLLACNEQYRESAHPDPDFVQPGIRINEIYKSAIALGHYVTPPQHGGNLDENLMHKIGANPDGDQLELSGDRHVRVRVTATADGDAMVTRTNITEFVRNERRLAEHARTLQAAKDEVERRSLTDPLTGLPNRRRLDQVLSERKGKPPAPLVRIDLDRFKQVNDVLGHEAGDFVLKTVADIMRRNTRGDDLPARIGGDEFVIACEPGTSLWGAQQMAERLLDEILKPVIFGTKRCVYGASFGIAMSEKDASDTEGLLRDADFALYRAKDAGRGRVVVFTPELRAQANSDRALADGFVEALARGEIVPYFQTQHDAHSWAITGVEVLARWVHPTEGVMVPPRFLDIVRQMGMEAELDAAVFASAIEAVQRLRAEGLEVPRASFNVSAARIIDPAFMPSLRDVPREERERISFEILESVSVEALGETLRFAIEGIKDLGYRIEVDDFGSGHASINSLLDIQPDALKIDRNLIAPLGSSDRADTMVAATIELARATGVEVIAEGVDSPEKARILAERGCDKLQGYYFSRPMPADDLAEMLRKVAQGGLPYATPDQARKGA